MKSVLVQGKAIQHAKKLNATVISNVELVKSVLQLAKAMEYVKKISSVTVTVNARKVKSVLQLVEAIHPAKKNNVARIMSVEQVENVLRQVKAMESVNDLNMLG